MSPLTKVFVMLLVVSSLLNAAAIVVYVNKEQVTDQDYKALSASNASLQRDVQVATNDAQTARTELTAQEQLAAKDATDTKAALDKLTADLASKDADNKQLLRNNEALNANLQSNTDQLSVALVTVKQDAQMLNDLRDVSEKQVQSQAESDAALARQRQLAETYGRQVEYLSEQVKKAQDTIKAYSSVITQNHLNVPEQAPTQSMSGPPVSGQVVDKQAVNGVTYLTISVGSTDSVQPGMEFRVVDSKAQEFLGILTITRTDANSSTGRLESDDQMVSKVQKGDEVTTEIQ